MTRHGKSTARSPLDWARLADLAGESLDRLAAKTGNEVDGRYLPTIWHVTKIDDEFDIRDETSGQFLAVRAKSHEEAEKIIAAMVSLHYK